MKKIILLVILSSIFSFLSKINAQISKTDSLEALLSKQIKEDSTKVDLLNQTAATLYKSESEQTLKYANEAKKIAKKINYPNGESESLRIIGLYYYYKSNYPTAQEYYAEALQIAEKHNDKHGIVKCFINIGNVSRKQSDYLIAIENFQKALILAEEIDDKPNIAKSLGNIGLIHWRQENYSTALVYYQKSLKIATEIGNKKVVSNNLNNIGILYYFLNKYNSAIEYLEKSLKIDNELGDKSGVSYSYQNIAEVYKLIGNYKQAFVNYNKALAIRTELGDQYGICTSNMGLGDTHLKTKNYKKALSYTLNSLELAKELDLLGQQKDLYEQLSKIYSETKSYQKAYESYVQYKTLNDSIFNEENIKKIAGLEYQYEFEKEKQASELEQQKKDAVLAKEAKLQKIVRNSFIAAFVFMLIIALTVWNSFLQKRKANKILATQKHEIEEKNKALKQLNATQNRLMSIISHDFKAPLSAFYSITFSLKTKFDNLKKQEIDNYFDRMLNSSVALKLQLENMLNWAINQTKVISVSKKEFNLSILSCTVILVLQEFAREKSITIEDKIGESIEIETDGKLLSIVLNNLLANAVKFSPPNSSVVISTINKNNTTIISIKDSGIGMNDEMLQNLFTPNAKLEQTENSGTGLGLMVSKDIVDKLGGKIWAESKLNEGSEFFVQLQTSSV